MAIHLIALSMLIGIATASVAAVVWRRRQRRRLLNSRETAHLLRQAQYLQQLVQTTQHCSLDPDIPGVLLRLAEETLTRVSTTGQPDAQASIAAIRELSRQLEQAGTGNGDDNLAQVRSLSPASTPDSADERDYARIRLHLTDTSRLLHRALRKGYIDRHQHQRMTDDLQQCRQQTDIEHLLRRETEARIAGDQARARACLSQARARLDNQESAPRLRHLLADIDRRLAELDRRPLSKTGDS